MVKLKDIIPHMFLKKGSELNIQLTIKDGKVVTIVETSDGTNGASLMSKFTTIDHFDAKHETIDGFFQNSIDKAMQAAIGDEIAADAPMPTPVKEKVEKPVKAVKEKPDAPNYDSMYNIAMGLMQIGEFDKSISSLEELRGIDKKNKIKYEQAIFEVKSAIRRKELNETSIDDMIGEIKPDATEPVIEPVVEDLPEQPVVNDAQDDLDDLSIPLATNGIEAKPVERDDDDLFDVV